MKKVFFLIIYLSLFFNFTLCMAQSLPTYNLKVKNFFPPEGPCNPPQPCIEDFIEFDIYLENTTNPPINIEYSGGQFYFFFNPLIASGNTQLTYTILGSDFLTANPPRPDLVPSSARVGIGLVPPNNALNILSLVVNDLANPGNGFMIPPTPSGSSGFKLVHVRLQRTTGIFNLQFLDLIWKNDLPLFYTRIFTNIGNAIREITTPNTHTVELNPLLPVELTSFNYIVNRNNVTLNWLTSKEINNAGFDIERKFVNANDWIRVGNVAGSGTTQEPRAYIFTERVNTGKYSYRLKQIDYNGNFEYFILSNDIAINIPNKFNLSQNYPNPFNPTTKLDFDLPKDGDVKMSVYDNSGRLVNTIINQFKTAGYYTVDFNAANLASGIYYCRLEFNSGQIFEKVIKMAVLK